MSVISILSFLWTNAGGAQTGLGFKAAVPEPATLSQSLAAGRSRAAHREMRPKFPLCGEGSAEFLPLLASAAGVALLPGGNEGPGGRIGKHFCFSKIEKKTNKLYAENNKENCQKLSIWSSAIATSFLATPSSCLAGQQGGYIQVSTDHQPFLFFFFFFLSRCELRWAETWAALCD